MTTCPSCGSPARVEDRFCGRCGTQLGAEPRADPPRSQFCTNCGGPLEEADRFCGRCGSPVPASVTDGAEEDRAPDTLDDQEFFADWNMVFAEEPPPPPRTAVTEAIPRPSQVDRPETFDTAVLPEAPAFPPSPVIPPSPAGPEPSHRPGPRGFPWGASVALVGAVAVIASAILPWTADDGMPRDIAARTLIDPHGPSSGVNLGVVLLVLGTVGALAALLTMVVPRLGFLRRLVGLAGLAVPALFLFRSWDPLGDGFGAFLGLLAPGVVAAGAGAILQIVAGKWFRR